MSKAKEIQADVEATYPEVKNLKKDAESMKQNTVELARHVKDDVSAQAKVINAKAHERYEELKEVASAEYHRLEERVKEKPSQSLAIAAVAGLALGLLLGRR